MPTFDYSATLQGLVAGLTSTGLISTLELPVWKRWGMKAVSEWHMNQALMARIAHRPAEFLVLHGLPLHFAHGGIAGLVFGVGVAPFLSFLNPILVGTGYGVVLWFLALVIMKPVTGVGVRHHPLGFAPFLFSLLLHVMYGALVGLFVVSL